MENKFLFYWEYYIKPTIINITLVIMNCFITEETRNTVINLFYGK